MKYRLHLFLTLFCFSFVFPTFSLAGSGRIVQIDDKGNAGSIIVTVSGSGTLWVGCTVYASGRGGWGSDLDTQKVKGSGEVRFNVSHKLSPSKQRLDYVIALWEKKISLRECEKKYGKGSDNCKWARRNGYQMENRLDRREGAYKPGFN